MADINDFMAGLFQGRAVSAESLREMKTSPGFGSYGLGLWQHGGSQQQRRAVPGRHDCHGATDAD